eukprot:scaffold1_cov402-Prasinococcus_capsulatus_cf.AAC.3
MGSGGPPSLSPSPARPWPAARAPWACCGARVQALRAPGTCARVAEADKTGHHPHVHAYHEQHDVVVLMRSRRAAPSSVQETWGPMASARYGPQPQPQSSEEGQMVSQILADFYPQTIGATTDRPPTAGRLGRPRAALLGLRGRTRTAEFLRREQRPDARVRAAAARPLGPTLTRAAPPIN